MFDFEQNYCLIEAICVVLFLPCVKLFTFIESDYLRTIVMVEKQMLS